MTSIVSQGARYAFLTFCTDLLKCERKMNCIVSRVDQGSIQLACPVTCLNWAFCSLFCVFIEDRTNTKAVLQHETLSILHVNLSVMC